MVAATPKTSADSAEVPKSQSAAQRNPSLLRGIWRLVQPLRYASLKVFPKLPSLYLNFLKDRRQFSALGGDAPFSDLSPALFDKSSESQSGGGHYFYQDIWAIRKLVELSPNEHHDVGSRLDGFVGQATAVCPVVFWDIRKPNVELRNFEFRFGELPNLPLPDKSISSLSCLHVLEHLGLGRYGDAIDPRGTERGLVELMRVLKPGGHLLISLPIGRERVSFNAERVSNPHEPIKSLHELNLVEFNAVNDDGHLMENVSPSDFLDATYSCGLYLFQRPLT
jgi:SAM-dependent methyltransferase